MRHATQTDLPTVYKLFRERKNVFPHIRKDYLERMITADKCIYEEEAIIIYNIYKVATHIGFNTRTTSGDCNLKQIIGIQGGGKTSKFLNQFFDYLNNLPNYSGKLYLSVRSDNKRAKKFYERNGMHKIDNTDWSNGTILGDIYFKQTKSVNT